MGDYRYDYHYKEVFFNEYCKTCKYDKCKESDEPCDECLSEPCDECLSEPTNLYSHKPINWEEQEK